MSAKNWILASRPKTLLASLAPVGIGSCLAAHDGGFHLGAMLAALIGAVAIQVGTNYCNDYFDFFQGADTSDRKGPTRAVQAGLISPQSMAWATGVMFVIALLATTYLYLRAGPWLIVVGIVSVVMGVGYTAGRRSLAYLGLADPVALVFFGPVAVGGTYFVQALQLPSHVIWAGLPPGLLAVALLVVNNLRDVDEDRQANKRTLAVRFGKTFSRVQYTVCVLAAAAIPLYLAGVWSTRVAWASLVAVPGLLVARLVWARAGIELRPCLGMTAGLLLFYSVVFCVALLL